MPRSSLFQFATMSNANDALEELAPPLPEEVAAAQASVLPVEGVAPPVFDQSDPQNVLIEMCQLIQVNQSQQTDLIQKLHKTVLTSRSMINELVVSNNELKEELQKIKNTTQCDGCKKKEAAFAAQTMLSVAGERFSHALHIACTEVRINAQCFPVYPFLL